MSEAIESFFGYPIKIEVPPKKHVVVPEFEPFMVIDGDYDIFQFEELVKQYYDQIYKPRQKAKNQFILNKEDFVESFVVRYWDDAPYAEE